LPILRSSNFAGIELYFFETENDLQIAYSYNEIIDNIKYELVFVTNVSNSDFAFTLPKSDYEVYLENYIATGKTLRNTDSKNLLVKAKTSTLLVRAVQEQTSQIPTNPGGCKKGNNGGATLITLVGLLGIILFAFRKRY
jgi:hypothetical protein